MNRAGPDTCRDGGFFVLRTPLLPLARLLELGSEPADLAPFLDDPLVWEALAVASPDLVAQIPVWREEPRSERGRGVERALRRYLARLCARATPFGLFAGCTLGRTGPATVCALEGNGALRRHTRLDMDYLDRLVTALAADPRRRAALRHRPNTSLYEVGGRLRYAESRPRGDAGRAYHLVSVEPDPYLRRVLAAAAGGARPDALAAALVEDHPEVDPAAARAFVDDLIDAQLLVSELALPVTGPGALAVLLDTVAGLPAFADVHAVLERVAARLGRLDAGPPQGRRGAYDALAAELAELPVPVRRDRLVQVDSLRPARALTLGPRPLAELRRAVDLLHRLGPPPAVTALDTFRDAFRARYGTAEVPLTTCLDEESGLGFMASGDAAAAGAPALAGLPLGGNARRRPAAGGWDAWTAFQTRILGAALVAGRDEIVVTPAQLEEHADPDARPLPDAFCVFASLAAASAEDVDAGRFRLLFKGLGGPSGARMLGRFCHLDPAFEAAVADHLRAEEAFDPEAVYAEIVHLPEGRIGNILCRPVLRDHEIPFLGRPQVPADRCLAVSDLLVGVQGDEVVLRSRRLGRRVVPRLTSAHGFLGPNLGLYRFLASLQGQGRTGAAGWSWGPLESAPFLPRVRCGRLVLACARWALDRDDLAALADAVAAGPQAVAAWREARRLPRLVELVEGDNCLLLDLERPADRDLLVDRVASRPGAVLRELFPGPDALPAAGPEGRLAHELVVPMTRAAPPATADRPPARARTAAAPAVVRRHAPGSAWLYAKLYAGPALLDGLLAELVTPLVAGCRRDGLVTGWFFLRYGDPDWHLRLRLRGEPDALAGGVLPRLHAAAAPWLADGRMHRLQLDTYEREIERYGGPAGIGPAERLFEADSDAALALLPHLAGDEGATRRWRVALLGVDMLLADLGFDLAARAAQVAQRRAAFFQEFGGAKALHRALGLRYRKERAWIERALQGDDDEPALAACRRILRKRGRDGAEAAARLRAGARTGRLDAPLASLAGSLAHMHVNRLLRDAARAHELLVHDQLERAYRSLAARVAARARVG